MAHEDSQTARERLMELAEDPEFRPFILGYLVAALDERFWPLLVQNALEHAERASELLEANRTTLQVLHQERWT